MDAAALANGSAADAVSLVTEFFRTNSIKSGLLLVLTLAICVLCSKMILRFIGRQLDRSKLEEKTREGVLTVSKILLAAASVLILIATLGVNTTLLTSVISVLLLGLTLAMDDILRNLASGLVLRFTRPFMVGDYIQAGSQEGFVKTINLAHTKIESWNGTAVFLPNKELTGQNIINWSATGKIRVDVSFRAPYEISTEKIAGICVKAMKAFPGILEDPAPSVAVMELEKSAVRYEARCWADWKTGLNSPLALRKAVREALQAEGIEPGYDRIVTLPGK